MDMKWVKTFMDALKEEMDSYTDLNQLEQDESSGLYYLQSAFSVTEDGSDGVMVQSLAFELREDVPQLEIVMVITNEISPEAMDEVKKAANGLNFVSPIGAFGVQEGQEQLYLRTCVILGKERTVEELVKEIKLYYEMMLDGVQGVYEEMKSIWEGKKTYKEALENKMN